MRIALALLAAMCLPYCAAVAGMNQPQRQQYFVLDKDRTRTEVHGLKHVQWVVGLRAGTYKLVGEDRDGLYFSGDGDCILILVGKNAEQYLQNGDVVPLEERTKTQFTGWNGGHGGIWLPKPGIAKPPFLFWPLHVDTSSPLMGLVTLGIAEWLNHQSARYSLGKEDLAFLDNLPIVTGSPTEPPEKPVENP